MTLQTDPLYNLLTTHPIQVGWELSIELNWTTWPSIQYLRSDCIVR